MEDKNRKSLCKEDKSLGLPNIDNSWGRRRFLSDIFDPLKDGSGSSGANVSGRSINDRLKNERMKALAALQKSQNGSVFKRPLPVHNKEHSKSVINVSSNNPSMQLDHTDYVPFRRPNAINISDLITDETINLESISSCPTSVSKDVKVSFEPTEITGRSTLYNKDIKGHEDMVAEGRKSFRNKVSKTKNISVNDILASSFSSKARNLCETLQSGNTTLNSNERPVRGALPSTASTSFSSYNGGKSLPRTADMSLSKNTYFEDSFNCATNHFSFSSAVGLDESGYFAPGELMQSKIINDEISWAQRYGAIPAAALSEQAKAKALQNSGNPSNGLDLSSFSNSSMFADDQNFSIGNFFKMRSHHDNNIIKSKSPEKRRSPVALVDEEDNTVTTSELEGNLKISITPKVDNKTYTHIMSNTSQTQQKVSFLKPDANLKCESKDSGNSTESVSNLLSISDIDRALCKLDIQSDVSGVGVTEQLMIKGKNSKSCSDIYHDASNNRENNSGMKSPRNKSIGSNVNENIILIEEMILGNKENVDPTSSMKSSGAAFLSDTVSFSESLLNTSDMKNLQRSIRLSRSPLSPIDVNVPNIRISQVDDAGEEADNDEWPDTPKMSNRRIRRTKSPRDKSPLQNVAPKDDDSASVATPVNSRSSYANTLENKNRTEKEKESKSMSSTRLDGEDRNQHTDFRISPNLSKNQQSTTTLVVRSSNTLGFQQAASPKISSPNRSDNSPMSSPHSCNLSQLSSPTPTSLEFRSPNLDATPNSERHLLNAGVARKVITSPAGSEASSACSYGTLQTYRSGRSVSRCSSSSEFSHRDGKQIPLKVTNTELSWGSIKLRSNSRKSMQIKNIISKRLVIRIEVSGPGYQIVNSQRSNTITLYSQECRTISISFCPTVRGVAIGKLSFYAPSGAPVIGNSFLDVPLYGYGGNASIIAQNISIGPVGSPFVTLGDVCELAQPLERTVTFYNKGPLLGFASVSVDSIGLMLPRLSDAFEIHPRRILIPPKHVVDVRIVFRPKREEIRKIVKRVGTVLTLANMRVICGDEANRQRIRRLLSQMAEEERCKLSSTSLDMVWSKFPQEEEMTDLCEIKENSSVSMDLTSFFRIHEILLTINHDNMDETSESSSIFLADVDETVLFRTIYAAADSPAPPYNLGTVDEISEDEEHVTTSSKPGSWSISPPTLVMNLNKQMPVTLYVQNRFKSRQFFEVVCNLKEVFNFTPSNGYVSPDGGEAAIHISPHANFQCPSENVYIMVYMENERIMVPVNFIK